MRNILKMVISIILSLLIIGAVPVKSKENLKSFQNIEAKVIENTDFIQNGIKVEYITSKPIDDEGLRIYEILKEEFDGDIKVEGNTIFLRDSVKQIKVIVWSDNENTKVQIIYMNNSKTNSTSFIRDELVKVQDISAKNIKYFDFIKVKIIQDKKQNVLEILEENIDKKTLETLDIYNGSVGKSKLYDGNKINIGIVKYTTGEYLVIGTPVIFVTY